MDFNRILRSVSSSPFSMKVAKIGFQFAHALNAEVALIYVVDRTKESVSIESGPVSEQSQMLLLKEAQETIEQIIKMYNGAKSCISSHLKVFQKKRY